MLRSFWCFYFLVQVQSLFIPVQVHYSCPSSVRVAAEKSVCYLNNLPCLATTLKILPRAPNKILCTTVTSESHARTYGSVLRTPRFTIEMDPQKVSTNVTALTDAILLNLMTHEFGHALGLEHTENYNSTMFPVVPRTLKFRPFDANELLFLRRLDGVVGYGCN